VGQVLAFPPASAAPGFERAAAAFVAAHTGGPGAWAAGTVRKCRETFGALGAKLPGSAADGLAALETEAGRTALARAFDAAFGELAPATYARHLSALRSAITWWRASKWLASDPTAGWARPKIPVDTTRTASSPTRPNPAPTPRRCWPAPDTPPYAAWSDTPGRDWKPSRGTSPPTTQPHDVGNPDSFALARAKDQLFGG
jgi:hypothetical protein